MPKKITSHKHFPIRWRKDRNCFQVDLRTIGGERQNFDTKAEATQLAKEMFEVFDSGKAATEIKPWTVEKAIAQYLAHSTRDGQKTPTMSMAPQA